MSTTKPEQPIFVGSLVTGGSQVRTVVVEPGMPSATTSVAVRPSQVWNQITSIPTAVPAPPIANGATISGVIRLVLSRPLALLPGATRTFRLASTPTDLTQVVHVVDVAGGAIGDLRGYLATPQTQPSGYDPVITDANGAVYPADNTWVADDVQNIVQFPNGLPVGMATPIAITFFSYVGLTGGTGGGGGSGNVTGVGTTAANQLAVFTTTAADTVTGAGTVPVTVSAAGDFAGVRDVSVRNLAATGTVTFPTDAVSGAALAPTSVVVGKLSATGTANSTTFLRGDGQWAAPTGSGNVVGPVSSTATAVARYSGTSGTALLDSGVTIDGSNNVLGVASLTATTLSATTLSATNLSVVSGGTVSLPTGSVAGAALANTSVVVGKLSATGTASSTTFLRGDGQWAAPVGTGNVTGPVSSTATAVPRYTDTTGTSLLSSSVLIDGSNNVSGVAALAATTLSATNLSVVSGGTVSLPANAVSGAALAPTSVVVGKLSATGTANSTTFLRGDGQWATPAGGGGGVTGPVSSTNTAIAIYSGTGGNTLLNTGVTIDGSNNVSGVATLSAATLSATNLTVSGGTVSLPNGSVAGAALANGGVTTAKIADDNVSPVKLSASATTPDNTRFYRGDGVWALPPGGGGSGNVTGPVSSTATAVPRYANTSGTVLVDSGVTVDGSNNVTGVNALTAASLTVSTGPVSLPAGSVGGAALTNTSVAVGKLSTTGTANSTTFLRGDGQWVTPAGSGDVVGPAGVTATDAIARYNGTTGKLVKDSLVVISDAGAMTGLTALTTADLTATGTLSLPPTSVTPANLVNNSTTADNTKFYRGDGRWEVPAGAGTGDVVGPAGVAANNAVPRYSGITGKLIKDSGVTISDAGVVAGVTSLSAANLTATAGLTVGAGGTVTVPAGSIAGAAIANGAINNARMAANSVDNVNLIDNAVSGTKILDFAVGTTKLANISVTNAKLAADAVATGNIVDSAVTLQKLGVTGTPLGTNFLRGDGTWNPAVIGPVGATNNALVRYNSPSGSLVKDSLVVLSDLGAMAGLTALTTVDLTATGVVSLPLNSVTDLMLADNSVTTTKIQNDQVTPVKLQANSTTPSSSVFYRGDGQWATPPAGNVIGPAASPSNPAPFRVAMFAGNETTLAVSPFAVGNTPATNGDAIYAGNIQPNAVLLDTVNTGVLGDTRCGFVVTSYRTDYVTFTGSGFTGPAIIGVATGTGLNFSAGDFIAITGATAKANNGLYVVLSVAGDNITINAAIPNNGLQGFAKTLFDTTVANGAGAVAVSRVRLQVRCIDPGSGAAVYYYGGNASTLRGPFLETPTIVSGTRAYTRDTVHSGALLTGDNITLYGASAGAAAPGNNTTAVGYNALNAATGIGNTAFGSGAGSAITTGTSNVYVGKDAGSNAQVNATHGVAVGFEAAAAGVYNTAVGASSVISSANTLLADSSVALGPSHSVTGARSVVIGSDLTAGADVLAIGPASGSTLANGEVRIGSSYLIGSQVTATYVITSSNNALAVDSFNVAIPPGTYTPVLLASTTQSLVILATGYADFFVSYSFVTLRFSFGRSSTAFTLDWTVANSAINIFGFLSSFLTGLITYTGTIDVDYRPWLGGAASGSVNLGTAANYLGDVFASRLFCNSGVLTVSEITSGPITATAVSSGIMTATTSVNTNTVNAATVSASASVSASTVTAGTVGASTVNSGVVNATSDVNADRIFARSRALEWYHLRCRSTSTTQVQITGTGINNYPGGNIFVHNNALSTDSRQSEMLAGAQFSGVNVVANTGSTFGFQRSASFTHAVSAMVTFRTHNIYTDAAGPRQRFRFYTSVGDFSTSAAPVNTGHFFSPMAPAANIGVPFEITTVIDFPASTNTWVKMTWQHTGGASSFTGTGDGTSDGSFVLAEWIIVVL